MSPGVGGAALGLLVIFVFVVGVVTFLAYDASIPRKRAAGATAPKAAEPAEPTRSREPRAERRATPRLPAPREVAPTIVAGAQPDVAAPSDAWPPPRAFTERCRAPNGGCAPECTPLAGGRCLDPCFIHGAECSRDCLRPDGTCGWPPPDNE